MNEQNNLRVKIFHSEEDYEFEETLNKWFKENRCIIQAIHQSQSDAQCKIKDLIITIWYYER